MLVYANNVAFEYFLVSLVTKEERNTIITFCSRI